MGADGVEEVVTNLNSPTKRNVKVSLHSAPQLNSPFDMGTSIQRTVVGGFGIVAVFM